MYRLADVQRLHLELTSACNARCPMCPRNLDGGAVNPALPVTQLRVADLARIFPAEFCAQLRHVRFCGNYGDPVAAADLPEACAFFRAAQPQVRITVHTNGGLREPAWWEALARATDCVRFGIDGLADTNQLYRRGVAWERVERAVRAFVGAGGHAEWDYLVFRHNEHQVEAARALAAEWGVARVHVKRTRRFLRDGRSQPRHPVRAAGGEIEYFLEPPQDGEWRNEAVEQWQAGRGDYERYLAETPIRCKAAHERELYVSAEGLVFPCCYLAQIHPPQPQSDAAQVRALLEAQPEGIRSIDARAHRLQEIVEGPLFREVAARWECGPDRLRTCAKQCGEIDFFAAQFAESHGTVTTHA